MTDRVSTDGLRAAYLRATSNGVSQSQIAQNCGWIRTNRSNRAPFGDITYVKRLLGIVPFHSYHSGKRYTNYRRTVSYEDAVKIALAIGVDPVDVGI